MGNAASIVKGRLLLLLLGLATIEAASAGGRGSTWGAPAADLPADAPASAQPSARTRDPRPPDGPGTQWIAGRHYEKLQRPVAELSGTVVEFFLYACRHCFELEAPLAEWASSRPEHVEFLRIPVVWRSPQDAHARLFYTLRVLGRDDLDGHVFATIHEQKNRLVAGSEEQTLRLQMAFAAAHGISPHAFATTWRSARVENDLERARQLAEACRIDAVPAMVIDGKYLATAGRAGGKRELMRLVTDLVSQELASAR
jgi:thiol:disulfide interchange protein DsbA